MSRARKEHYLSELAKIQVAQQKKELIPVAEVKKSSFQMGRAAREKFPYSVECKNQERLNLWEAYSQAESNCGDYQPVVFLKKNNHKPLVLVDADYFVKLHKD